MNLLKNEIATAFLKNERRIVEMEEKARRQRYKLLQRQKDLAVREKSAFDDLCLERKRLKAHFAKSNSKSALWKGADKCGNEVNKFEFIWENAQLSQSPFSVLNPHIETEHSKNVCTKCFSWQVLPPAVIPDGWEEQIGSDVTPTCFVETDGDGISFIPPIGSDEAAGFVLDKTGSVFSRCFCAEKAIHNKTLWKLGLSHVRDSR
jgi:hypothetical protein